jgi:hypothetical protein
MIVQPDKMHQTVEALLMLQKIYRLGLPDIIFVTDALMWFVAKSFTPHSEKK